MSHDNGTETFTVAEVEAMFREAVPVKRSAVREVRRHGDYFIKFDRRNNHGFAREFATARRLKEAGLPVVNHLFCGQGENGHYLVTGSFADSVAVDDFLRTELPDMAFFETIADLAKSLLGKGFLHADFHLGNLLYNTRSRTFALVDVRQVRQMPLWLLNNLPESSRFHVLTEFRGVLRRRELLQLFRRVGVAKPGNFYEDMLSADNAAIRDEWPRRRKQILSGYPKFTRKENGVLYNSHADDAAIAAAVEIPGGKAVFLAGFFLDLVQIPHRKLVKFDPATDRAYAEPECKNPPGGESAIEMMQRLNFYDIPTAPADWRDSGRGLPHLNALNRVAGEPFILEE